MKKDKVYGQALDDALKWANIAEMYRFNGQSVLQSLASAVSGGLYSLADQIKQDSACSRCGDTGTIIGVDGDGREASEKCGH